MKRWIYFVVPMLLAAAMFAALAGCGDGGKTHSERVSPNAWRVRFKDITKEGPRVCPGGVARVDDITDSVYVIMVCKDGAE